MSSRCPIPGDRASPVPQPPPIGSRPIQPNGKRSEKRLSRFSLSIGLLARHDFAMPWYFQICCALPTEKTSMHKQEEHKNKNQDGFLIE